MQWKKWQAASFRTKAIMVVCLVSLLCLTIASIINYTVSYRTIAAESQQAMTEGAAKYAATINGWLSQQGKVVEEMTADLEYDGQFDDKYLMDWLKTKMKSNPSFGDVYIGFNDRRFIDGSGWNPPADFNCTQRPWYLQTLSNNALTFTLPYKDGVTGKMAVSVAKPVTQNGTVIGVVAVDIYVDFLTDLVQNAKLGKTGYAFLLDRENNYLVHPLADFQPTDQGFKKFAEVLEGRFKPIAEQLNQDHPIFMAARDYDNVSKYLVMAPIPAIHWTFGYAMPEAEFAQKLNGLIIGFLIAAVISLILTVLLAYFFVAGLLKPIRELTKAAKQLAVGDTAVTIAIRTKDEIGELGATFQTLAQSMREQTELANGIADGDLTVDVKLKSEHDLQGKSMQTMVETLRELAATTNNLTHAAAAGQLSARGDADRFNGVYAEIVQGVNQTLDIVVKPLQTAAQYVERIGRGDIPERISDDYQGDFNELKQSINACIDGLEAVTESNRILQSLAGYDFTDVFAKEGTGIYGEMAQAIKNLQQQLIQMQTIFNQIAAGDMQSLEVLRAAGKRSENDQATPALIRMMNTIQAMVGETLQLSEAAVSGQLDTRGAVAKFEGEYRRVIEGFNATLDAVVAPLNEANVVLGKMAYNDFSQAMDGTYHGMLKRFADQINLVRERLLSVQEAFVNLSHGDTGKLAEFKANPRLSKHDHLRPAMIAMMQALQDMVDESNRLSSAAIEGRLDERGDLSRYEGKYREIIEGLNGVMAAMEAPLAETSTVLQAMAQGNLMQQVAGEYQGEYAQMKQALNDTLASFSQLLGEINIAARQVALGSRQVSDGSQALSQGATEQASTLEQLTASMAEVAFQTKQNALRAGQANELANTTKANALQGNEQMQAMVAAMAAINESAAGIAKIIKVIDEIAFQTNILALNAAVEAARAGQHGKGFAVVAEEVRNLAARSAKAAKETTVMIESSIQKVDDGTKVANQTATALSTIVSDIAKAAELVNEIAIASNEQATGIAQINQGIMQVSQVTQTNTATAEESAASSQQMSAQAEMLQEMVGTFHLRDQNQLPQLPGGPAAVTERNPQAKERSQPQFNPSDFGKY